MTTRGARTGSTRRSGTWSGGWASRSRAERRGHEPRRSTMASSRASAIRPEALLRPGQRVPATSLPAVPDGRLVALREPARGAPVIVVLRSANPEEGADVLVRLTQAHHSLEIWAGRPLVIVPASVEGAARLVGSV